MSDVLRLEGALTMSTVGARVAAGRAKAAAGDLAVDLSAVSEADSAALALLFDWMRTARAGRHTLTMTGLPAGLRSLAALYGVDELLPAKS
ncbi:STAS domain-containing protein [Aromatoleum sp.]|uniref:STAS domain-containing protein n=1 Tax=Aromatoleum sp. TaxID=2307007 RepID=UPI002FC77C92